jgi:hypothetical protein
MNQLVPSKKVNVYLETEDGAVFTGQALVATVNIQHDVYDWASWKGQQGVVVGKSRWDMELSGVGDPLWVRAKDEAVEDLHSALEWRCPWCGGIMPRERRQCTQCGGFRSFVYDLMD